MRNIKLRLRVSVQFNSVAQLCLCDPMDCSRPGLPVHHQLLVFTQTHVHQVSRPLLLPTSIFPSIKVSSLHQVPKGLEFQLQHQSFQ